MLQSIGRLWLRITLARAWVQQRAASLSLGYTSGALGNDMAARGLPRPTVMNMGEDAMGSDAAPGAAGLDAGVALSDGSAPPGEGAGSVAAGAVVMTVVSCCVCLTVVVAVLGHVTRSHSPPRSVRELADDVLGRAAKRHNWSHARVAMLTRLLNPDNTRGRTRTRGAAARASAIPATENEAYDDVNAQTGTDQAAERAAERADSQRLLAVAAVKVAPLAERPDGDRDTTHNLGDHRRSASACGTPPSGPVAAWQRLASSHGPGMRLARWVSMGADARRPGDPSPLATAAHGTARDRPALPGSLPMSAADAPMQRTWQRTAPQTQLSLSRLTSGALEQETLGDATSFIAVGGVNMVPDGVISLPVLLESEFACANTSNSTAIQAQSTDNGNVAVRSGGKLSGLLLMVGRRLSDGMFGARSSDLRGPLERPPAVPTLAAPAATSSARVADQRLGQSIGGGLPRHSSTPSAGIGSCGSPSSPTTSMPGSCWRLNGGAPFPGSSSSCALLETPFRAVRSVSYVPTTACARPSPLRFPSFCEVSHFSLLAAGKPVASATSATALAAPLPPGQAWSPRSPDGRAAVMGADPQQCWCLAAAVDEPGGVCGAADPEPAVRAAVSPPAMEGAAAALLSLGRGAKSSMVAALTVDSGSNDDDAVGGTRTGTGAGSWGGGGEAHGLLATMLAMVRARREAKAAAAAPARVATKQPQHGGGGGISGGGRTSASPRANAERTSTAHVSSGPPLTARNAPPAERDGLRALLAAVHAKKERTSAAAAAAAAAAGHMPKSAMTRDDGSRVPSGRAVNFS
ncbi:hypothetical protein FOA52_002793 [Chlamydomonas sp. UWO 241]|nr:hypothetical protein FOA52_002793 [Chlamydomonas sp. UWO 241]